MKTNQRFLTLAVMMAFAVSSCGKHQLPAKPEPTAQTDPSKQAASTDGGDANKGKDEGKKEEKGGTKIKEGALVLGSVDASKDIEDLANVSSNDFLKKMQTMSKRFADGVTNELVVTVLSIYDEKAKKLSEIKGSVRVKMVSSKKGDEAPTLIEPKNDKLAPVVTVDGQDVGLIWDKTKKEFVSDKPAQTDLAEGIKTSQIKVAKIEDEAFKNADEFSSNLAPVITLENKDGEPVKSIVIDTSKDPMIAEEVIVKTSYDGAQGDPQKPICSISSQTGIGATKPIVFKNVIQFGDDAKIDLSKITKENLEQIAAGKMNAVVVCMTAKSDKSPNLISITASSQVEIEIKHAAPAEVKK